MPSRSRSRARRTRRSRRRARRGARFPDDLDLAALEATLLREKGDKNGALAIVSQLRAKSPSDPKVLARVADFYRRAGDFSEAEERAAPGAGGRPQEPRDALPARAPSSSGRRSTTRPRASSARPCRSSRESAPVLNYLGYMNADRNVRVEEAYSLIQKAVAIEPQSAAYQDSLGWALYRLNRWTSPRRPSAARSSATRATR
jgi:Flp pilus assembly protein TadD